MRFLKSWFSCDQRTQKLHKYSQMKRIYEQVNLIAHRGFCNGDCENTFPAFLNACKKPFWGIETDIQFTSDNHIVCFHDKTIYRLMGEKTKVSDLSYKELFKKPFKNHKCVSINAHICTFQTYLKICKKYKKQCIIEIKTNLTKEQLETVINKIKRYRYTDNCHIISFNQNVLKKVNAMCPDIALHLLIKNPLRPFISLCKKHNITASMLSNLLTKDMVKKLIANNIKIGAWTVNDKHNAQLLIDMGISYITTDRLMWIKYWKIFHNMIK